MKKLTVLFMGLMLVFMLTACSSQTQDDTPAPSTGAETETAMEPEDAQEDTPEDAPETFETPATGKTLVVYYSATGTTKEVAEHIAEAAGGETFSLEPTEPYSDGDLDWTNEDSRVVHEHDDPDARNVDLVTTEVPDWGSYDTVFIGYPIWWGIAAWPVDTFIKANDFTGKTVIPFCTSSSSDLGDSGRLLEEMAGTGNWSEGRRFSSSASKEEVQAWAEDILK